MNFLSTILNRKRIWRLAAVGLLGMGYFWYQTTADKNPVPEYALALAERGVLNVSISGSGQVSPSNQIDVKSKIAGTVLKILARNGQTVRAGEILAQLDARDAYQAVREAALNLESAELALKKLQQPADALATILAENALAAAEEAKQQAQADLVKTHDDGFTTVANAFLDLPIIIAGLRDLLMGNNFSQSASNMDYYVNAVNTYDNKITRYRDDAFNSYQSARSAYDKNFSVYKASARSAERAAIKALVAETYDSAGSISEAVKNAVNLIQFYEDKLTERDLKPDALADAALASLNTYTSKTNGHLANLLAVKNTLRVDAEAIVSAERSIAEKMESLAKLKSGPNALDVESQKLTLRQRQATLAAAEAKLFDYTLRAPVEGIIAKVGAKASDSISAATAIATLVSKQKLAEISLNEVDVAKIKIGQTATLTFDAVPDLSIAGAVAEIETLGNVTQGVVNYIVKVFFDTQDERIKSGMSVSAAITIATKTDALMVPTSAVKTQGGRHYVEMFAPRPRDSGRLRLASKTPPRRQLVEIGLANDTLTEIISGLNAGDQIVARAIASAVGPASGGPTAPNFFSTGGRGFGGNTVRPR